MRDTLSYTEHLLGQGLTLKTVVDYQREVDLAVAWFAERGLSLQQPLPSELIEYAKTRPNTPGVRSHLRSALRYWWEWNGVQGWPNAVKVPKLGEMVCKALTPEQAHALCRTALGWWREGAVVLVGAYLGLRNHEIAGMRWDGFDEEFEWYRFIGKGNRQRIVAVHPVLAGELKARRNGSPYVFEGRFDGHISHASVSNWVAAVARKAGIEERVWPHRLRHTFGATANDNTENLRAVQIAMGHSKPETTAGYTRATAEALRRVSDSLNYLD